MRVDRSQSAGLNDFVDKQSFHPTSHFAETKWCKLVQRKSLHIRVAAKAWQDSSVYGLKRVGFDLHSSLSPQCGDE